MRRQPERPNQPRVPKAVITVIAIVIALGAFWLNARQQVQQQPDPVDRLTAHTAQISPDASEMQVDHMIQQAFQQQRSGVAVQGQAVVKKVLPDDNKGSRHQRFIIELSHGQTVLIAHNIDLADRIENVQAGEQIGFKGDYEYNPQGGVIHWTHHDPQGQHADGWLQYQGRTYQ